MPALADNNSAESAGLLERSASGDRYAIRQLFDRHRERLRKMIDLRFDRRLVGKVPVTEILDDILATCILYLPAYYSNPRESFFLWARQLAAQRLAAIHREHLGENKIEISLYRDALPVATAAGLAAVLLGQQPLASRATAPVQRLLQIQDGLNLLDPLDRELLALRHFENLSGMEAAQVLEIEPATATRRYIRALKKLNELITSTDKP